mmetsp:Transcript_2645/g.5845  ORF Transcript_2645/g.5845 Transcript_2645/m.5845 type:complete len:226 (-) Transcript_2645:1145-1822(-)
MPCKPANLVDLPLRDPGRYRSTNRGGSTGWPSGCAGSPAAASGGAALGGGFSLRTTKKVPGSGLGRRATARGSSVTRFPAESSPGCKPSPTDNCESPGCAAKYTPGAAGGTTAPPPASLAPPPPSPPHTESCSPGEMTGPRAQTGRLSRQVTTSATASSSASDPPRPPRKPPISSSSPSSSSPSWSSAPATDTTAPGSRRESSTALCACFPWLPPAAAFQAASTS